jgi:orotidine-5'-phosphate decarboxylase
MVEHFGDRLFKKIRSTKSFLCLGIDPHLNMIPEIFNKEHTSTNNIKTVEKFCFSLLDTAYELVPAIKPQIALFEQLGPDGMKLLSSLCKHAESKGFLVIMDAKRGDIGSTSQAYANAYLGKNAPFPSDALTVNPWLGIDSLEPFFKKASETGSGLFILAHTSNKGSKDIQEMPLTIGIKCYEHLANILKPIVEKYKGTSGLSSIGIVSGATFKEEALALRKILPSAPFLIPGYGTQGASAENACAPLIPDTKHQDLQNFGLINASRSISFPEESYLVKNIEEWQNIILTKINSANNELMNIHH